MTVHLTTHIRAATVYRNGALVTREGILGAEQLDAADVLVLPGLPLLMRSDSVRLRIDGAGLQAGPLEEAPTLLPTTGPSEAARAQLRALQRDARAMQAELEALRALREAHAPLRIVPFPAQADERPREAPDLEAWLALEDLARASDERLALGIQQREARLRALASEEASLQASWSQPAPDAVRATRTLQARLGRSLAVPPDAATITLEYFVPGVRWAPVYEVHIDSRTETARLVLGAQLAQATGEDWHGVSVSASTADLQRDATAPRLTSWRIGRHAPPRPDWRPLPEDLDGLFADHDLAARSRPVVPPPTAPPTSTGNSPPPPGAAPIARPSPGRLPPIGIPAPAPPVPQAAAPRGAVPLAGPPAGSVGAAQDEDAGATSFFALPSSKIARAAPAPTRTRGAARQERGMSDDASEAEAPPEGAGFGGGGPMGPETPEVSAPNGMMDHAWLRLSDAEDRRRRGKLLPVDLLSDLRAFVEDRPGGVERVAAIGRALEAQRATAAELARTPLPAGCQEPTPHSFQHRYPPGPRVDLPSDGRFRRIRVLESAGRCRLLLRGVPRQDDRIYRFALLENPLRRPLLPGPIQVYLDGEFMVTGQLPGAGAGARIALNIGVEPRVRVARNTTFQQSEHGTFTTSSRLDHRVRLEVRSNLPSPAVLELYERLPERADEREEIKVELVETVPPPSGRDKDVQGNALTGVLRWDLALNPGGRAEVNYRYTIDISARKELVGGNRREP